MPSPQKNKQYLIYLGKKKKKDEFFIMEVIWKDIMKEILCG